MTEEQIPPPSQVAPPAPPLVPEEPQPPDPLAISVATEIARLRREAGLSERAAARKLGTSQTQLRRMEDPRYLPSLRSLARVARAYGHRVEIRFAPIDERKRRPPVASPPRGRESVKPKAQRAGTRKGPSRSAPRARGARG